jgi:Fe-S cluster assembly iron-binding protein IscA
MISVNERAARKLKDIIVERCSGAGLGFRVVARSNDTGSLNLSIILDKQGARDKVTEFCGVRLISDPETTALFADCELDYMDEPTLGFFVRKTTNKKPKKEDGFIQRVSR